MEENSVYYTLSRLFNLLLFSTLFSTVINCSSSLLFFSPYCSLVAILLCSSLQFQSSYINFLLGCLPIVHQQSVHLQSSSYCNHFSSTLPVPKKHQQPGRERGRHQLPPTPMACWLQGRGCSFPSVHSHRGMVASLSDSQSKRGNCQFCGPCPA